MNLNNYEKEYDEIPKHRKKSNKATKKANHKHEYEIIKIKHLLTFHSTTEENCHYIAKLQKRCIICDKIIEEHKSLTEEEFELLKENLLE